MSKRVIEISAGDAKQVRAILLTHAELQDQQAIPSMELLARLKRDNPRPDETVAEMIEDLRSQVNDLEADSDNLQRIAVHF